MSNSTTITDSQYSIPFSFDDGNSVYDSIPSGYPVSNGFTNSNSTSQARFYITLGKNAETFIYYNFNFDIPSGATITSVTANTKVYISTTSAISSSLRKVQLFSNGNPKGTSLTINQSTSVRAFNLSNVSWTAEELNNLKIRLYVKRGTTNPTTAYYLGFYGADVTVEYTYQQIEYCVSWSSNTNLATANVGSGTPASSGTIYANEGTNVDFFLYTNSMSDLFVEDNGNDMSGTWMIPQQGVYKYTFNNIRSDHNIIINRAYNVTRISYVNYINFNPSLPTKYPSETNVYTEWTGDITNCSVYDNEVDVTSECSYNTSGGQYVISNIQTDHIIKIYSNNSGFYIKKNGEWKIASTESLVCDTNDTNVGLRWKKINKIIKKINGVWVEQTPYNPLMIYDTNALFMSYDSYINTPYYGVSEFRVDKSDLSTVFGTLGITFQDYLEDLNDYSTARCIPDKYIKVGELTIDGTTYYRYDGYVNNNTRHTESVGGNTYYVGMLVPSTFQFKRVNTIKYTALMPSQSINGYMILIDSNNTVYHTIPNSPLNTYSIFGQDEYPRVLVDFTI